MREKVRPTVSVTRANFQFSLFRDAEVIARMDDDRSVVFLSLLCIFKSFFFPLFFVFNYWD